MKKLTKKQHREIIKNLIEKNQNVRDLRDIQQVAEFFEEDAECRKEGSVLVAADAVRLLFNLINAGCGSEAYSALYELWNDYEDGLNGSSIYDEINEMLHRVNNVRYLLFVRELIQNLLK
ncbi:MAG: hypothetical protein MR936_15005 [Eubacterium sp.]|nr:hypothetical protein [Eubacterium sp.]